MSWTVRIVAAVCLLSLCFALFRIVASGAGLREVFHFFYQPHMAGLLPLIIFGAFISIRMLFIGRGPDSRYAPGGVPIEERFARGRKDLIGKLVVWGAILAFTAIMIYIMLVCAADIEKS